MVARLGVVTATVEWKAIARVCQLGFFFPWDNENVLKSTMIMFV